MFGSGISSARLAAVSVVTTPLLLAIFILLLYSKSELHSPVWETLSHQQRLDARYTLELSSLDGALSGQGDELDEAGRRIHVNGPTVIALILSAFVSALANSAGVGGGVFFVPLFK